MDLLKKRIAEANRIIDALHGTGAVARRCKISAPAISSWRKNGIPDGWLAYFKLLKRTHPEIFKKEKG